MVYSSAWNLVNALLHLRVDLVLCFLSNFRIRINLKMLSESLRAPNLYGIYSGFGQEEFKWS